MDCSLSDSSVHGISHTRILESVAITYIHRIFPTQRSDPCLLHLLYWQLDSLPLCHLGSHISKVQSQITKRIYFINNSKKDSNFFPLSIYYGLASWKPTPVFLPGKSHGQRSLAGCSPWGCEEWDMTENSTEKMEGKEREEKKEAKEENAVG